MKPFGYANFKKEKKKSHRDIGINHEMMANK
jgi:hypothetical protein